MVLNLLKFQIKWRKKGHMWRERHCRNLLSDFEINTCKKIFTNYEHLLNFVYLCGM